MGHKTNASKFCLYQMYFIICCFAGKAQDQMFISAGVFAHLCTGSCVRDHFPPAEKKVPVHSKFTPFTVLLLVIRVTMFLDLCLDSLAVFFQSHVWTQNVRSFR